MPLLADPSYPPAVAAPSRQRPSKPRPTKARASKPSTPKGSTTPPSPARVGPLGRDPDGGGRTHDLLTAAVEESARLLDADGALLYLVDPTTGHLHFAHDAGIRDEESQARVRVIELEPGTGMFGRAVAERSVIVTGDYPNDPAFQHAEVTDRVAHDIGIRSMVVAPLVDGPDVFGALGTFSSRTDAFTEAQIAKAKDIAARMMTEKLGTVAMAEAVCILDNEAKKGTPIEVEVQTIALGGDIALVALPGEIFVELGLAIKAASPFKHTLIAELANGSMGYVPTEKAYPQGNYEVVSARGAPGSGERLVATAIKQLKELKTGP